MKTPNLPDHRTDWQKRADEDWDYQNDDDMGTPVEGGQTEPPQLDERMRNDSRGGQLR